MEIKNVNFTTDPPEASTVATGTGTAPNAGSVAHSNGNQNYHYLAVAGYANNSAEGQMTAAPTNYDREDSITTNGTTAVGMCYAHRDIAASTSDDPGAFTLELSSDCIAFNVAMPYVEPPGGGGGAIEIAQAFGII
jgi:hypothetical protein